MSEDDPPARERPLVFNPEGFLVAILEDTDQLRHYGHGSQQDIHIR